VPVLVAMVRRAPLPARLLAAALLLAGLAVGIAVVAVQTESVTGLLDVRIYRGAAARLAEGGSLYDFHDRTYGLGSTYPPFASLLFRVLTVGSVGAVEYAVTLVNVALWWALMATMVGWANRRAPRRWDLAAAGALALATMPSVGVWNTLNQGQVNLLLWAALVADLALVDRRHPLAGVLTGVAAAVKLVPLVVLAVYGLVRRPAVAVRGALAFAVATLVAAAVLPADSRRFWFDLLGDTSRIGSVGDPQNNSLRFLVERAGIGGAVGAAVWLVLVAGVTALAVRALRAALDGGALVTAATMLGAVSALVSPIAWMHHLVFLAFPTVLLLPEPGAGRPANRWRFAGLVLAVVALADPLGDNGRHPVTAALRALAMVGVLVAGPWLARVEQARGRGVEAVPPVPVPG
jgi:alpha-1,2-mannosyltransferase